MKFGNDKVGGFVFDERVLFSFWITVGDALFTIGAVIEPSFVLDEAM